MSHHFCCAAMVCCPPGPEGDGARAKALVAAYEEDGGAEKYPGHSISAEWLLENLDVVPHGLGAAIVEAFEPLFKQRFREGVK